MRYGLLFALAVAAGFFFYTRNAECTWCPTYKCFSSCGINCPCISGPGEIGGRCYGVNALPDLLAHGYRELP